MASIDPTLAAFTGEWEKYQGRLVAALAPLSAEQLALRATPRLRSIGQIAAHLAGVRARWLHLDLGEGGAELSYSLGMHGLAAPDL